MLWRFSTCLACSSDGRGVWHVYDIYVLLRHTVIWWFCVFWLFSGSGFGGVLILCALCWTWLHVYVWINISVMVACLFTWLHVYVWIDISVMVACLFFSIRESAARCGSSVWNVPDFSSNVITVLLWRVRYVLWLCVGGSDHV